MKLLLVELWFYLILFAIFWSPKVVWLLIILVYFLQNNGQVVIINAGLLSSLSVKHPLLLISFMLLFPKSTNNLNLVAVLAIILGSFWAEIEFNWGGWWSFDFVENSILITYLFYLVKLHITRHQQDEFTTLWVISLIFFFFLKFNNIESIHSFVQGSKTYYFWLILTYIVFLSKTSFNKIYTLVYVMVYLLYSYITIITSAIIGVFFIKFFFKKKKIHLLFISPFIYIGFLKLITTTKITIHQNLFLYITTTTTTVSVQSLLNNTKHLISDYFLQMKLLTKPNLYYNSLVTSLTYPPYIIL